MPKPKSVVFSNPNEPAFIRKMKEKVGYNPTLLRDKFPNLLGSATTNDFSDDESDVIVDAINHTDRAPQLVIPKDIDEDDLNSYVDKIKAKKNERQMKASSLQFNTSAKDLNPGKILFTARKRSIKDQNDANNPSSSKPSCQQDLRKSKKPNRKLLSFDINDNDDDTESR
ncbi:hypothetical protein GJ496_001730 [Pomphorhynchus laevis]|nr:hypothetical protein GJ496_001730 [Pomphorhynchus laevis]